MMLVMTWGLVGCAPRVCVTPNPGPDAGGIRYYRPKPYLKVTPALVPSGRDEAEVFPNMVTVTLEYLPDFAEEYAIDVRSGLGIANVAIKLEDGWNLTEISQELDSQTDENIAAAADLIKAVGGVVPTRDTSSEREGFTVQATDVPLGYYEAVISRGPDGRKRLYGFRYLGFFPYEPCPLSMGGAASACCYDPMATLYGLTFDDGRMVFRPLTTMRDGSAAEATRKESGSPVEVRLGDSALMEGVAMDGVAMDGVAMETESDVDRQAMAAGLETRLLSAVRKVYPGVAGVVVTWEEPGAGSRLRVEVRVECSVEAGELTEWVERFLGEVVRGRYLYEVRVRAS